MKYSRKLLEEFTNPKNVGVIEDADGVGQLGNPADGDVITIYIKVKDDVLEDVKFKTYWLCGSYRYFKHGHSNG
jgi:nitrogen fixation NifU-like protein